VIEQTTRGWDDTRGVTFLQRSKEGDTGYRYFPEPDLPPLDLDPAWIEQIKTGLPELPDAKLTRYIANFGLTAKKRPCWPKIWPWPPITKAWLPPPKNLPV